MTELEKLPTGWLITNLKQVVLKIQYGYTASAKEEAVGPKLLRITDLQNNSVDWASVPFCECSDVGKYALKTGDIVIARTGATTGKSFLLEEVVEDTIFASYLIRLSTSEQFPPNYLAWFMRSLDYWQQIIVVSKGSAQPGANANILSELKIPLPPLNEQRRIVAKIEGLTARSRKAREALDAIPPLLDQFRQSVLAAAFRGDLTADWRAANPDVEPTEKLLERIRENIFGPKRQQKLSDLPDPFSLPSSWKWVSLSQICRTITDGDHQAPPQTESGIPFLVISNVCKGYINFENTRFVPEDYFKGIQPHRKPEIGDVLYTAVGSYGVPVVVETEKKFCFQRHIALLKLSHLLKSQYVSYALQSDFAYKQATQVATGTAQMTVTLGGLQRIKIPLVSPEEQEEVVRRIKALFEVANNIRKQYVEANDASIKLDQSILAKAFRGELVPQDPNDEPASFLLDRIRGEREKAQKPEKVGKGKKNSSR